MAAGGPQRPEEGRHGGQGEPSERHPLAALGSGPIPKGQRHTLLPSALGKAHDRERTLEEFTELALEMNERLCVPPIGSPGDDDPIEDVVKMAEWVHARPTCLPQGKRAPEEVQRRLLAFEEKIGARSWPGHSANRYSLLKTCALEARKHGEVHGDDVAVSISDSQLALHNGVSKSSVKRNKRRSREDGLIATDNEGRGHTDSGKIVLLIPTSGHLDNHTEPGSDTTPKPLGSVVGEELTRQRPPRGEGGVTSQLLAAWSAIRARHGKPIYDQGERIGHLGRMGKRAEFAVDLLEEAGGRLSQQELAAEMGVKRPRNMRASMWLTRLLDAGVVGWDGDEYLALTADWLAAWDRRRVEDDEEADRVRDRDRYRRMSKAWADRVAEHEEKQRARRLEREALACFDGEVPVEADGFVSELEPVEDSPTLPRRLPRWWRPPGTSA